MTPKNNMQHAHLAIVFFVIENRQVFCHDFSRILSEIDVNEESHGAFEKNVRDRIARSIMKA